jgi:hypothetical protein
MAYWLQEFAANPIGASVYLILLATVASLLLYGSLIVRAWFKKLLEQASFMVPHHIGISSTGRAVSPSIFVIELGRTLVVGYSAKNIKDAERVCKRRWLRKGLQGLVIEDGPAWNGKTEIAARKADASESVRFIKAVQICNGTLLDRSEASDLLKFVLVDRNKRRIVKIGYS